MDGWMDGSIDWHREIERCIQSPRYMSHFFIHVHFDPGAAHNQFAEYGSLKPEGRTAWICSNPFPFFWSYLCARSRSAPRAFASPHRSMFPAQRCTVSPTIPFKVDCSAPPTWLDGEGHDVPRVPQCKKLVLSWPARDNAAPTWLCVMAREPLVKKPQLKLNGWRKRWEQQSLDRRIEETIQRLERANEIAQLEEHITALRRELGDTWRTEVPRDV